MIPPVGKSGPGTNFWICLTVKLGLSINALAASKISHGLNGGILVAYPAAIPTAPLINKFGIMDGKIVGSFSESSKLYVKSTVSLLIFSNINWLTWDKRHSVYRIAAAGSPSMEPLLPCISSSGKLFFHDWDILTIAS